MLLRKLSRYNACLALVPVWGIRIGNKDMLLWGCCFVHLGESGIAVGVIE